jgi:hypothetical protein
MNTTLKQYQNGITSFVEIAQAMVEGLKATKKMKNFKVNMYTFGDVEGDICYGCAATATMMQLTGKKSNKKEFADNVFRPFAKGLTEDDVIRIEYVIDSFRKGYIDDLVSLCKLTKPQSRFVRNLVYERPLDEHWCLEDTNWEKQLPEIQKYIDRIVAKYNLEWYEG